jgi:hypothetical protein
MDARAPNPEMKKLMPTRWRKDSHWRAPKCTKHQVAITNPREMTRRPARANLLRHPDAWNLSFVRTHETHAQIKKGIAAYIKVPTTMKKNVFMGLIEALLPPKSSHGISRMGTLEG